MQQQQGMPRVTPQQIKDAKTFECGCGGKTFSEKIVIKKISPILSPTGKEEIFPMNILICDSCQKVPKALNPDGMIPEEFVRED